MIDDRPAAAPLRPLHARRQRAGPREGQEAPRRRADPRPRGRRRARRQGRGPRPRVRGRHARASYGTPRGHDPGQRPRHPVARRRPRGRRRRPGPTRVVVPKINSRRRRPRRSRRRSRPAGAPDRTAHLGDDRDAGRDARTPSEIAAARERLAVLVMGTNDLAKELHAEHVPGPPAAAHGLGLRLLAARAAGKVILDGVYNDIKDADGFAAECRPGPRARLRRQDADPPEPARAVQPRLRPERGGGRAGPRGSSPPSRRPRPTGGAWSPSTAAWSRTCTSRRRGGCSRWPRRSPAGNVRAAPTGGDGLPADPGGRGARAPIGRRTVGTHHED